MKIMRLDSVVFDGPDIPCLRKFYVDILGLPVGTYQRDGKTVADENESYFNLNLGGSLLGFEKGEAQLGTVVLIVTNLTDALGDLQKEGVKPVKQTPKFAIIHDPDGREIILQAET